MKVAFVYDRVNKWGGAERVLLALHKMFPQAPLYTSVYNPRSAPWANVFTVHTSFLQRIPLIRRRHELVPFLMPLAFEQFNFSSYDLVISVTSEAAKGIITSGKTKHLCYCLTPTRYLWSGYETYFSNHSFKFFTKPAVNYLRNWDKIASSRPDKMVAISKEIQSQIKTFYNRESQVIYPPLLLTNLAKDHQIKNVNSKPYLLIVSRLVNYKRIDLAIKACNRLKLPLYIIGTGNDYYRLQMMSGPTINFLGGLSDSELITYYKNCSGFIFPGREDFGLTALEAQYYGKPVLAYNQGGVKEIVINGQTGMFFDNLSVESLAEALTKFVKFRYNPNICRKQAEKFSLKGFEKEFKIAISNLII